MYTIKVCQIERSEGGSYRERTVYEQTVETLDVAAVIAVVNGLQTPAPKVFKAYLLKESLEQLWDYRYEGAMLNYLQKWLDQLRWQRLPSFQKLAETLLKHLDGMES